jgi:hypothetical protein
VIAGGLWARSGWAVRGKLERIRETGHPLSPSDLMEESGSPGKDAAPHYRAALALVEVPARFEEPKEQILSTQPAQLSKELAQKGRALLDRNEQALRHVRRGAERDACRLGIGAAPSMERMLRRGERFGRLADLLEMASRFHRRAGQESDAVREVRALLRLSRPLRDGVPMGLASYHLPFVWAACEETAALAGGGGLGDERLRALDTMLAELRPRAALKRTLRAERAFALGRLRAMGDGLGGLGAPSAADTATLPRAGRSMHWLLTRQLTVSHLTLMRRAVALTHEPWPALLRQAESLKDEGGVWGRRIAGGWAEHIVTWARAAARGRATRLAVRAVLHRRAHGTLPASPSALADDEPELAQDPFTGDSLKWERAEGVLRIRGAPSEDRPGEAKGASGVVVEVPWPEKAT